MTRLGIEFGMSYRIPALPTKLPLAAHPDFEQMKLDIRAWMRPYLIGHFGETAEHAPRSDNYITHQYDLWGVVVYPYCHPEKFVALGACMIWVTLLDDAFSAPGVKNDKAVRAALLERLNSAIDGSIQPESPLECMLDAGMKLIYEHPPASMHQRIANRLKGFLSTTASENKGSLAEFKDFDSYLQFRRTNLSALFVSTFIEWGVGVDLEQHVDAGGDVTLARNLIINHWTMVNGIYSFPKEIELDERMNSVFLLMDRQGLSLQAALDRLAEIALENEARFLAVRDRILASPLGSNTDVSNYLEYLGYGIPGNLYFHRKSGRYNGVDIDVPLADGGATASEPTVLRRKGTVYDPFIAGQPHVEASTEG